MPSKKSAANKSPEVCPVCGEDVPRGARACPECGADERSGWREDASAYDGTGLPEEDFNYADFVRDEFGSSPRPAGLRPLWWITAILLFLALLVLYFSTGR